MWVKATDKFEDFNVHPMELTFIPSEGHLFEVTKERFAVLNGNNAYKARFVEAVVIQRKKKKAKDENKIAIIMPNYNYEPWLQTSLGSILEQTYTNYEIIFIDDCSTDKSVKVAKSMLKKPHKVVELKQKRYNGGARNEGYLHVSTDADYIWYVDSDDFLPDKNVLEVINENLRIAPDVLFVGMDYCQNGGRFTYCRPNYSDKYEALQGWSGSCGKVIRKELAMNERCLYNEGTLKEDKNHHYKICLNMQDFICLPRACYVWNRDNKKSVTSKRDKAIWKTSTIRNWADATEIYLNERGHDARFDRLMEERLEAIKAEILSGGDRQF